ncbi:type I restriction enzyme, R subunit [Streptomyces sp. 2231.1]|uniref:EcoAI/FtnUII family type I restriction enzme subunit R n=1 Tax=Streptomyces sp. 2231.1 TaxID=1855347 RepID=UPI00089887BC|nr:DEAD/DEAH box helicase family protein [Streptomyces sp. 2231.1]SED75884.1 type I restriction enzyme, R subunit [Streptomyces sp. 2231.1]
MVEMGRDEDTTCREYILPMLRASGWRLEQIKAKVPVTPGRIVRAGRRHSRERPLEADYVLQIADGVPVAVVEAKREFRLAGDGLDQGKVYAAQLDLPIVLSSNGHSLVEFDFTTGVERELNEFPRPDELWERYLVHQGISDKAVADVLREPFNQTLKHTNGDPKEPRYYQRIAIHRAVAAILGGECERLLLTMATGTGKTFTAMQIAWKVSRYWDNIGQGGRRRVLYLADRDVLIDQPMKNEFGPVFGEAVHRIRGGKDTSRSVYFATYQALTAPGGTDLYRQYPRDFFDLVIVDECHRGSAGNESSWRGVLDHFGSAVQLGLTATPKRDANVDTYAYFRDPLYTYSLRQGIADGYLAPYRVRRVMLSPDAHGWSPDPGQLDRFGREIPPSLYGTRDFERVVSLISRTRAAAQYLTDYMRENGDRMAKTVVFCVDSEHALDMRREMTTLNSDMVAMHSEHYAARIVSKEGDWGKQRLAEFQDPETPVPVIATTSRMLSTGVDIPTLRTVVLLKPIGSIVEFKQIIGRGTRLAPEHDKLSFEIIDFVGATALFEDPEFDGPAESADQVLVDEEGSVVYEPPAAETAPASDQQEDPSHEDSTEPPLTVPPGARKYIVEDIEVHVTAEGILITDPHTGRLRLRELRDYTAEVVRHLYPSPDKLRSRWRTAPDRDEVAQLLANRGIALDELLARTGLTDTDPFDALVHIAWNTPAISRHERVYRARRSRAEFFTQLQPEAREVVDLILERYAVHGPVELRNLMDVLSVEPINILGAPRAIASRFGGPERLRQTWSELQGVLYAA